jgi:hypothetical protein
MWIQAKRDPTKEWLQLRHYVTGEEVKWAMKDCNEEWKVPVILKKLPKSKQQVEAGPSWKSTNPKTNTRKETECAKEIGCSTTITNPR